MRASIYLSKKELQKYLESKGYESKTIRKVLIDEFGYKTGKQFLETNTNLCSCVLDIRVCYKNPDEYREIVLRVSWIIKYLEKERNNKNSGYRQRLFGKDIVFLNPESIYGVGYRDGDRNLSLWYYTETTVFRREFVSEVNEKLGLYEVRMSI